MELIIFITEIGIITTLFILDYYIIYKAKNNTIVILAGVLTMLSTFVIGIVTIKIGQSFKSEENENSSEVVTIEIPPNFEGGYLRTSDDRVVYVSWTDEEDNVKES